MSNEGGPRLGVPLNIRTNAFHLPKLKKDVVAQKRSTTDKPGTNQPQGAAKEPENVPTDTLVATSPDAASPGQDAGRAAAAPAAKLTTARKGKRAKPRTGARVSEVTVYYDAMQSPDDAVTKPAKAAQHKLRSTRAAAAQAATAEAKEAAGADHDAAAAAYDDDLYATEPEPMEADCYEDDQPSVVPMPEGNTMQTGSTAAAATAAVASQASKGKSQGSTEAAAALGGRQASLAGVGDSAEEPVAAGPSGRSTAAGAAEQPAKLRDGQEIFKYMQQLAEDAEQLLPQEQEQKRRGRGRAKKDLRLVDALHQSWKGKSYYERLQEITRQEVAEQEEETTAVTDYQPTNLLQHAPALPGASDAAAAESGSQQEQDQEAAMGGSQGGRKRKAPRSSIKQGTGTAGADDSSHPAGEASTAAAVAAATGVAGLPSKRRATAAAAAAAGRAASPKAGRPASRDAATAAAIAGTSRRRTLASAAGSAAAAARSPAPAVAAGRPGSSRANAIAACDSTPAAQNGAITERPPWSVGGPAAAAAGVVAGAAGATGAAAATGKADRGALQKLQAAYDAKVEELAAVKEQLKESQELVAKLKADQKGHPKVLQQLEKQRQALEKKLEAGERRQAALERDNEGLRDRLARQVEAEKAALQEQLSKSDKEVKQLRLKLKQANIRLDKFQAVGSKLQEMGAALVADAQPVALD